MRLSMFRMIEAAKMFLEPFLAGVGLWVNEN